MKKNILLCAFLLLFAGAAAASSSEAFDEMMTSYEDIRLVLLDDSVDGIAEPAASLRDKAERASRDEANGEVRTLRAQLESLAQRCSRYEADLQAATWRIASLTTSAVEDSEVSDHDVLETALSTVHEEMAQLKRELEEREQADGD